MARRAVGPQFVALRRAFKLEPLDIPKPSFTVPGSIEADEADSVEACVPRFSNGHY